MENCLLIGNGLNRTLKNSISWGDLLKGIADDYNVSYIENLSLPLEFESIVNEISKTRKNPSKEIYNEIKGEISKQLEEVRLPENSVHMQISRINCNSILTTNYDFLLEYAFDSEYKYAGDNKHTYLLSKTSSLNKIDFYHIHGMMCNPKSICLGYKHYISLINYLKSSINSSKPTYIKNLLKGSEEPKGEWSEKFYTSNISIVGLGLSESELDIWWLLTHRAYLYYANVEGLKQYIRNNITYYEIIDASNDAQKSKLELLKNEHVIVKEYKLSDYNNDYQTAYEEILKEISTDQEEK